MSAIISRPFENLTEQILGRIGNPFFKICERFSTYGRQIRSDIGILRLSSRKLVSEGFERIRQDEDNITDGEKTDKADDQSQGCQGEVKQEGIYLRNLFNAGFSEQDAADTCLNMILAGEWTLL